MKIPQANQKNGKNKKEKPDRTTANNIPGQSNELNSPDSDK